MTKALVVIDMQNDFITGSLAVKHAGEMVPIINKLREKFDLVVWTQDWHPADHVSFASSHKDGKLYETVKVAAGYEQMLFPAHCVQNTDGAALHRDLKVRENDLFVKKGMNKDIDSYSCFFDVVKTSATVCDAELKKRGVDTIYVIGVALDYCVKFSVLDALELGYKVFLVDDVCAAVSEDQIGAVLDELKSKGAVLTKSDQV